jgi:hypothetical protein
MFIDRKHEAIDFRRGLTRMTRIRINHFAFIRVIRVHQRQKLLLFLLLGVLAAWRSSSVFAQQQLCLPETDPNSPRKSQLHGKTPDDEILRIDVDHDGDPDILERWWNGKRVRWLDENDDMKSTDARGDISADSMQIDIDGDGYYDGPSDMNIKWIDDDGDGRADAQIVTINPGVDQKTIRAGLSHYMVFIDVDHDGVNAYVDWTKFAWQPANVGNWRTTGRGNYSPDYNGDSVFLKQHLPAWAVTDPRMNWENPFAFYDFDHDGCTEMAIRLLDTADGGETDKSYSGKVNDAYVTYDLDNDSQKDNEFDFDMTLRFFNDAQHKGDAIDYSHYSDNHKIRAPQWVLDGHYYRFDNYRRIDDFCYVTHDKAYDEVWKNKFGQCWFVFDEDDDDHRWERVEMYYPTGDVYSTKRWKDVKDRSQAGISGHPQADSIGDRGEWDEDNSGRGKLYVGKWDHKLHLFGAERGAWTVDYGGKYWGAGPVVVGGSSKENAPHVEEVVQYRDTDNNGFIDEITYDYDGDKTVDLKISLLGHDQCDLIDPGQLKWQGMHDEFTKIAEESFQDALVLYRAAWKAGLTTPELDDLAIASSTWEKYDHGYWLREKIFRMLDKQMSGESRDALRKAYFSGDDATVARMMSP